VSRHIVAGSDAHKTVQYAPFPQSPTAAVTLRPNRREKQEKGERRKEFCFVLLILRNDEIAQSFDVTDDGKQIVFDRVRENSDIVLIDLARGEAR
jgi:hypothetical protein